MSPVAPGIEIADIEMLLQTKLDSRHSPRDLARDEGLAAQRTFVIKQNAVGSMHAVGVAVIDRDPIGVELGHTVGRARMEGRGLPLWPLRGVAIHFGSRRLIEFGVLESQNAHCLEQSERT